MTDEVWDVIRGGPTLVNSETFNWLTPQEIDRPAIVFIHGFTAHGRYMTQLASYVRGHEFSTALFNYDSYRGIDVGASDLGARLDAISVPLKQHGYALVAHSMGGLVAIQHVLADSPLMRLALRGIVLLGVPCAGTLRDKRVITYMLDWADWLTGPNPYARNLASRSALQLTGNDGEKFLDGMRERLVKEPLSVPSLSVSGGMNFLEFGKGSLAGALRNRILQRLINNIPNDGLVPELSTDFSKMHSGAGTHRGDYNDFVRINHTFLTRNQEIAELIVTWLSTKAFL